ncbi:YjgN family protein [Taklimakanibacter lacteus]|uniref:YjgN family protein n=1 Tax=Taklimakanibacter lacteus TaxID=2268456 RepID=UPI000E66F176
MTFQAFGARGSGSDTPLSFTYVDKPGLGKIALLNALLMVLTLTVYRFWAKTNVRRHIWGCVHINGEPLEYTGRGIELFLGFLIVFAVFFLPVSVVLTVLQLSLGPEHPLLIGANLVLVLVIFLLWGMALYRARRYQLSRTLWRGIRASLVGSSMTYSLLYFGAMLLRSMTLGWSTPAMNLNLQERMTGDMRIGSMPFRFKGRAGPLYGPYAICWVVTLLAFIAVALLAGFGVYGLFGDELKAIGGSVTTDPSNPVPDAHRIGLVIGFAIVGAFVLFAIVSSITWAFYVARELSIFASYTTLDNARFRLETTAGSLIWLVLGNLLLIVFTLGIATPFAQQRLVRYLVSRLSADGIVDVNAILQSREAVGRTGEGLADAFDVSWI